jgi:AAA domain/Bifunctional DNA primase/polymerase, N-terminal
MDERNLVHTDIYDGFAPLLRERGYFPLPIAPGTKAPHRYVPSQSAYELFTGWSERPEPLTTPQPKAGIGVRTGSGIVVLDYDNEDAALRVSETIVSHVNKAGMRGWSAFFRADFPVPSENFVNDDGELMLQVLSDGRQTVLPPSIHPDTGQPYRWTNGRSLYDTAPRDLPELPADYRERIMALGYQPGGKKKTANEANGNVHDGPTTFEGPFQDINNLAMQNMALWVPELGLYKLRRERGYQTWTAVATWRPSSTGRPLEVRSPNLKISAKHGIVDFGDGDKGYSPLDLVMAARGCSLSEAMVWLEERVRPDRGPDVDFETLTGERPKVEEPPREDGGEPTPPPGVQVWHFGEPLPPRPKFLVPNIIPAGPVVIVFGGQWGTGKSFILDDLVVAIAGGGEFIGEMAKQGGVLLIELEASDTEARLYAAAAARGIDRGSLPIISVKVAPHGIQLNARKENPAFMKWAKSLVDYAKAKFAREGYTLMMIGLDCLVRIANFEDENNPSECQRVMNVLLRLSDYASCPVSLVDHHGKQNSAGLRGGSPKETNPAAIFETGEKPKNTFDRRHFKIRKMRNGRDGLGVPFWLEPCEVEVDQQVEAPGGLVVERATLKTLAVRWGGRMAPVEEEDDGEASEQGRRALAVLSDMISRQGVELPEACEAPEGLRGVPLEAWLKKLASKRVVEGKNIAAQLTRLRNGLLDRRAIDIGEDFVWVPL